MRRPLSVLAVLMLSWSDAAATWAQPSVAPLTRAILRGDLTRLQALLDAGEDPNAKDSQGFSPWMWAVHFGDADALDRLLARVSTIASTDVAGQRQLAVAASLDGIRAARILLDKGVPADAPAIDGATPLLVAASSGYTALMQVLLDAGANPNAADQHRDTPLMAAVRIGSIAAVRQLLRARADPNAKDGVGRTALHWAARSGRTDIMRALLEAGASIDAVDETGRTAMSYAREKEGDAFLDALRRSGARDTAEIAPHAAHTPREAAEKSLPLLVRGWQTWSELQTCGGCHHRLMIDRVAAVAGQHGFTATAALAEEQVRFFTQRARAGESRVREQSATEDGVLTSALGIYGDGSSGDALNLNVMLELGIPRSSGLEARALLLAREQAVDGRWRNGLPRVPILSSDFTTTAVAARTIAAYGGPADAVEIKARVARATQWLVATTPVTTDDKASRLLGLRWTNADGRTINGAADLLKREQKPDGGWSQLEGVDSDAYATGMVLVALHWGVGLPVTDPAYKRGVEYLLRTQEVDGSWLVPKRAAASNEYFESGFPHGKFQFISYAGSCWATMALMYAAVPPHTDVVAGAEFVAGANLAAHNVKAEGTIFVPDGLHALRAVIVLVESWPGSDRGVYDESGHKIDGGTRETGGRNGEFVDLAVGRFRDEAWRTLSARSESALLYLRLGTIRPEPSPGSAVNGVVVRSGISNRVVRHAAEGGADALLAILQRLGDESGHRELTDAPLVLWGWSAPGNFASTFAEVHPERTIAFVRYHSNLRDAPEDLETLKSIPALLVAGGRDDQAGTADAETLWKRGRSAGAPWTLAVEPAATHADERTFASSHALMIPWIAAVIRQRLRPDGIRLQPVADDRAWLGDTRTADTAPFAMFSGARTEANWLPDEQTARGWRAVTSVPK